MCVEMCVDMCVEMCVVNTVGMCVGICVDMCLDMCVDMPDTSNDPRLAIAISMSISQSKHLHNRSPSGHSPISWLGFQRKPTSHAELGPPPVEMG